MIVLKYEKTGRACFISHIDLLKHTARTIRRAGIPVKFSNGFSPHALLFFSAPLALGVSSIAEYLTIDTDMQADEVLSRFNANCPEGLKASKVFTVLKNPNLQGRVTASDYIFPTAYRDIDLSQGFTVSYKKKGEIVEEDVSDKILRVYESDGKLCLRLATGNTNLRPDRLLSRLNEILGTEMTAPNIVKIAQYVFGSGQLEEVDSLLSAETQNE